MLERDLSNLLYGKRDLPEGEEERKCGGRQLKETNYASKETSYAFFLKPFVLLKKNLRERRLPCHGASHPESAEVIPEEVAASVGNLRVCDFRGVCLCGVAALSRISRAFVRISRAFIIQQKTSSRGNRQRHA